MTATIQAFDEAEGTIYVLFRTGKKPVSAAWPHPLLELAPDAVRLPSYGFDIDYPDLNDRRKIGRPQWEPVELSEAQRDVARRWVKCEDCRKHLRIGSDDHRQLDLMRHDPEAPDRVWDSTKQKWRSNPRSGRAGGKRFRLVDLCRACAGAIPYKRPEGKRGSLPRRGGRPRLLEEPELRQLHQLYLNSNLSCRAIAIALKESRGGSLQGFEQSMLYGWRKLGLERLSRSEMMRRAHERHGSWAPPKCAHKGCIHFGDLMTGYCSKHRTDEMKEAS